MVISQICCSITRNNLSKAKAFHRRKIKAEKKNPRSLDVPRIYPTSYSRNVMINNSDTIQKHPSLYANRHKSGNSGLGDYCNMKNLSTIVLLLIAIFNLIAAVSPLNVTRPKSGSSDRDSIDNLNGDYQACGKYASTCHTTKCSSCMCTTGTSYMTLNSSCIAEKRIAKGCNYLVQKSATAPWSFKPVSVAEISELMQGIRIFHCTLSSCATATECKLTKLQYENNGWKTFPSSSLGNLTISENLLKLTGSTCYQDVYKGLMLSVTMQCNVRRSTTTTAHSSCLVMKVSGTYDVGTVPDANKNCNLRQSSTKVPPSSRVNPSSRIPGISNTPVSTTRTLFSKIKAMTSTAVIFSVSRPKPTSFVFSSPKTTTLRPKTAQPTSMSSFNTPRTTAKLMTTTLTKYTTQKHHVVSSLTSLSNIAVTSQHASPVTSIYSNSVASMYAKHLKTTSLKSVTSTYTNGVTSTYVTGVTSSYVSSVTSTYAKSVRSPSTSDVTTMLESTVTTVLSSRPIVLKSLGMNTTLLLSPPDTTSTKYSAKKKEKIKAEKGKEKSNCAKVFRWTFNFQVLSLQVYAQEESLWADDLFRYHFAGITMMVIFVKGMTPVKGGIRRHPPLELPPTPSIIQLENQRALEMSMGISDQVSLANSWNVRSEDDCMDGFYDIPIDPPGMADEESINDLYAKVDKLRPKYVVRPYEDCTSGSGEISPRTDRSGLSFNHLYDEPGSILGPGYEDDVIENYAI
eukprot:gene5963-6658_t